MGIKLTLEVINQLEASGIISRYAIAGAVAAFNYIEPAVTKDLDLLVSFAAPTSSAGLVSLGPILSALRKLGYSSCVGGGVDIEGWPVQFLPVASPLDEDALSSAEEIDLKVAEGSVRTRVLRPEHLVATAAKVGRPKDLQRLAEFLDAKAVDLGALKAVLTRYDLLDTWRASCMRAGIANPLA